MPDRPPDPTLQNLLTEMLTRLRALERRVPRLPDSVKPLQTLENAELLGETFYLDFGNGLVASPIGNGYVRVSGVAGELEFDAVVDADLAESDPDARLFKGIGECLTSLRVDAGLTERANVLVRRRNTTGASDAYVETGNVTAPDHVFLWCQPNDTNYQNSGQEADVTWDHANFTMTAVSWDVHGLAIDPGTTKTTIFIGRVRLTDCKLLQSNGGFNVGSVGSSGGTVLIRCYMAEQWYRFSEAYECQFRIYTPGTYDPSEGSRFVMHLCTLDADTLQQDPVVWTLGRESWISVSDQAPGGNVTFRLSGAGARYFIESACISTDITIETSGTPGRIDLRGIFNLVTLSAITAGYSHSVDVTCRGIDLTGPVHADVEVGTGLVTIRGDRVVGGFTGKRALSSGTQVQFLAATRANIQFCGNPTGSSGTFKPWTFDATSDRNILTFAGATGYPAAGTDAGTNNVIQES